MEGIVVLDANVGAGIGIGTGAGIGVGSKFDDVPTWLAPGKAVSDEALRRDSFGACTGTCTVSSVVLLDGKGC